ncbi:hypothetical protein HZS_4837 [Henneguya salminicola]|nr:hypothetical protein HZS_4837 [Henneguya salminicola]
MFSRNTYQSVFLILSIKIDLIYSEFSDRLFPLEKKIIKNSYPISRRYFQSEYIPDHFPQPENVDTNLLDIILRSVHGNNLLLDSRWIIALNDIDNLTENEINVDHYMLGSKFMDQLKRIQNISTTLENAIRDIIKMDFACRVSYVWKDYGRKHYPRYIKEGQCCGRSQQKKCCQPTYVMPFHILRYICSEDTHELNNCVWKAYKKHIITRCSCY